MSRFVRRVVMAPALAAAVLGVAAFAPGIAAGSTVAALWHMNEKKGATTMVDSSPNHNNGTLHNVTAGVPGAPGLGTAYQFGGSTTKSYVEVPDSPSLDDPTGLGISISFWMKTTHMASSGDYDLVRKGDFPGEEYKVELDGAKESNPGEISCTFHGSLASGSATGGPKLNDGKWHHVVCAENPTAITLTVNGSLVMTTPMDVGAISVTTPVEIGAHPTFDYYNGVLDEVQIGIG